jgi:adenylate cyclase
LNVMVDIIEERHGGMLNKFLGDGFMALFGIGEDDSGADHAVAAGMEMLERLQDLNLQLERDSITPLRIGVGIHTGIAVVGSIGSQHRHEYTAIGNTVNIASRVESLTKEVGEPLLLTAETRDAMKSEIQMDELPPQYVKGRADPVLVYKISTLIHTSAPSQQPHHPTT